MKKVVLFAVLVSLFFVACDSPSGRRAHQPKSAVFSLTDSLKKENQILRQQIAGLTSTSWDEKVKALSAMPEYKDVHFLTPKQAERCMKIFIKKADKYLLETLFVEGDAKLETDSGYTETSWSSTCIINLDTNQSMKAIATIHIGYSDTYFNKKGIQNGHNSSSTKTEVYYLPKINVMYALQKTTIYTVSEYHYYFFDGTDDVLNSLNKL